ncbi:MAG TPA: DUF4166 domain-containing protein [Sphingobium sp.]|uniref:DUF4166 domain-containing protein n=1 Tax=Sphingobium sp. TaxID=1912891 RepID=UPI002ED1DFA9
MDSACDQLLARATGAEDHHWQAGGRHTADEIAQSRYSGRGAGKTHIFVRSRLGLQHCNFAGEAGAFDGAGDNDLEHVRIDGLGEKVPCASFYGLQSEGMAEVVLSRNSVVRLLCRMMGLPAEGQYVPVTVIFERATRVVEHMGPTTNIFRASVDEGELRLDLEAFRFLGVPFPSWLRPHCHAREREETGHFVFDVPITIPRLGFIIRYTGHMERHHG